MSENPRDRIVLRYDFVNEGHVTLVAARVETEEALDMIETLIALSGGVGTETRRPLPHPGGIGCLREEAVTK
jgi:hypothetical protein